MLFLFLYHIFVLHFSEAVKEEQTESKYIILFLNAQSKIEPSFDGRLLEL